MNTSCQIHIDLANHFETPYVKIKYIREKRLVKNTFKGFYSEENSQFALVKLLQIARNNQCCRLLFDMRKWRTTSDDTLQWFGCVWLPLAYRAGIKINAFVIGENQNKETIVTRTTTAPLSNRFDVAYFQNVDDAENWLLKK